MSKSVLIIRGSGLGIARFLFSQPGILREFEKVVAVPEEVSVPQIPRIVNYPAELVQDETYRSIAPHHRKRFDHVSKRKLLRKGR